MRRAVKSPRLSSRSAKRPPVVIADNIGNIKGNVFLLRVLFEVEEFLQRLPIIGYYSLETLAAAVCSTVLAVKERFLSPWRRLSYIFNSATGNMAYDSKIAA